MQSYSLKTAKSNADELVEKYLPLVAKIAHRLAMGLPDHVDKDDLISSGTLGLLDAVEKYDPTKGALQKYVPLRIRGAMLDELRKMSWLPRSLMTKTREVEKAQADLSGELGRTPTEEELAVHLDVSPKEMSLILAEINTRALLHLEGYLFSHEEGEKKVMDFIPDTNEWSDPEGMVTKKEGSELLSAAIEQLGERDQLVLHLYYQEEMTLKDIGEVLEISESRVSQIHSRIMLKLRKLLKED